MAFTLAEEEILKSLVKELMAKRKLANAKAPMNIASHNAATAAATLVVDGYKAELAPLIAEVAAAELELKDLIE